MGEFSELNQEEDLCQTGATLLLYECLMAIKLCHVLLTLFNTTQNHSESFEII